MQDSNRKVLNKKLLNLIFITKLIAQSNIFTLVFFSVLNRVGLVPSWVSRGSEIFRRGSRGSRGSRAFVGLVGPKDFVMGPKDFVVGPKNFVVGQVFFVGARKSFVS